MMIRGAQIAGARPSGLLGGVDYVCVVVMRLASGHPLAPRVSENLLTCDDEDDNCEDYDGYNNNNNNNNNNNLIN